MNTLNRQIMAVGLAVFGLGLFATSARADNDRFDEKKVSCESRDHRRSECSADLKGYTVRYVDQQSSTNCVSGRNWGYSKRGVWVDEGCAATFYFSNYRGGDHPRSYGDRYSGWKADDEKSIKCESHDGKHNTCDADLRGYRIADVREISQTDCDIGRNFGYTDRGVWVDEGCRAEFYFTKAWGGNRDWRRDNDRN
jgi:hypothetical protein